MGGNGNHPDTPSSHRWVEMAPPVVSGKDRHLGARGRGGTNGMGFDQIFSEIKSLVKH